MKKKNISTYRLYLHISGEPIKGPYPAEDLFEYEEILDEIFLTDNFPFTHVNIIKYENNSDNPIWYGYSKEDYLKFKEIYLSKENLTEQKILIKRRIK